MVKNFQFSHIDTVSEKTQRNVNAIESLADSVRSTLACSVGLN